MKLAHWVLLPLLASPLATSALATPQCTSPPPPPYNGPGDSGPPPNAPTAPAPTGPSAPGPGSPSTPGPAGPSAPSAPPGNGPSTQPRTTVLDESSWNYWWNFNRDSYLGLKHHVFGAQSLTGSDEFYVGRGQTRMQISQLPSAASQKTQIGPALQRAVERGSWNVQSGALRAVAKLHPIFEPEGTTMLELITDHLGAPNYKVGESAVVALGILGDRACIQVLADIAADNEAGRKWMKRSSVPSGTRPLAALALGTLGAQLENPDVKRLLVSKLAAILSEPEQATPDLHVACVTSIGLTSLPEKGRAREGEQRRTYVAASLESQTQFLVDVLTDTDRQEYVRAHVPKALALLAQSASKELRDDIKESLLAEFKQRQRSDRLVRYGIVEALGMLGDADDEAIDRNVRTALHDSVRDGDNNQRGLSLVAIALASTRRGESAEPFAALPAERKYLLKQLANGKSRLRPWSALALGLQGYHGAEEGLAPSRSVFEALLASFKKTRSPADAGAWSIALGLLGELDAEEELRARLERKGDDTARGHAALGLGMLGANAAVPELEALVMKSTFHPVMMREASTALALLDQRNIVPSLLGALAEGNSAAVKTTTITALALVGDTRSVKPLIALLADERQLDTARSYSSTALGIVCETEPLPWTRAFSSHVNYYAMPQTMLSKSQTGLLSLR